MRVAAIASALVSSLLLIAFALGSAHAASDKYKDAVAVRNVRDHCNFINAFDVKEERCLSEGSRAYVKHVVEKGLQENGYLATGTPRYYVDIDVREFRRRGIAVVAEVTSKLTYTVSGAASRKYSVQATAIATLVSMPLGLLRTPAAFSKSLQKNAQQFIERLR